MTVEEKNHAIKLYCEGLEECDGCPLHEITGFEECWEAGIDDLVTDAQIERNYNILFGEEKNDVVNHPSHYCREGAMESIEEMVLIFGKEAVKHFCLCNCWKYRYRASAKNGEEDLQKSDWYMKKYKELCEDEGEQQEPKQISLPL